jgi:hypothetical protein
MPSSSGQILQRAVEKDAALIDALTDSFAAELSTVLDLLKTKIRGLIKKIDTNPDGRLVGTQQSLALALRMRADIIRVLEDAGYTKLALKAVDAPLDRLAAQVLNGGVEAVRIGAYDLDALVAMKQIRFAQILQVGEDIAANLWRVTLDGVLGARPVVDLVDDISDLLDTSAKQARTLYDTMTSTFSRQVGQIGTTGEPDEAFLYVGPDDIKTRDFCAERVDRVYSREAIEAMDNGQLPNVYLTGGGFSCRHAFRRVSALDVELLALMDTGIRYQDRDASVAA